jgi:hypothetical protein
LGAFDGLLETFEEELEVLAALDEVDVGGVDDQEVGSGVMEEEMFVGAGDFLDVFGGNVGFVAGSFLGDARAEDFGLGLEIDDQVGSGNVHGEGFVVALVELELGVIEIEIGEDAVLFHEEVGEDGAGSFDGEGFAEALLAFDEEVHLGAKGRAGLGVVEVGEEGIVLAIVDPSGVEAFGKDAGEGGFADAERAFDDDEAGSLRSALRSASALGGGGVVAGHVSVRSLMSRNQQADYSRVADGVIRSSRVRGGGYGWAKVQEQFHICGLVLPFEKWETEVLKEGTNKNATNGPVLPVLCNGKFASLRVGMDLHDPHAILR